MFKRNVLVAICALISLVVVIVIIAYWWTNQEKSPFEWTSEPTTMNSLPCRCVPFHQCHSTAISRWVPTEN